MSALPVRMISSACFGSVINPTAAVEIPVWERIASAKGT
jgi:hypothetical protein